MSADEGLFKELEGYIIEGRFEDVRNTVERALDEGADPTELLCYGIIPPIRKLVDMFEKGEVYLPTIVAASNFLEEFTGKSDVRTLREGAPSIAIGTVEGDIHEIGKNICGSMLRVQGYNVVDLGADVPNDKFISAALKERCRLIAASAAMKGGLKYQKELVKAAAEEDIPVLVGGASCNERYAESIGAGYSRDAKEFIRKVDCRVMDTD